MLPPITLSEFSALWRAARPPIPPRKIAVAFSGGVDSLCLLHLMQTYLQDAFGPSHNSLISITIDHLLQPTSSDTANRCSAMSASLGIPNIIAPIPWSSHPFPPIPSSGQPFEEIARNARYHLLLAETQRHGVDTILMAHHADDQLETVLMRMIKEPLFLHPSDSIKLGYAGMKTCRPWGMGFGNPGDLGWAGLTGMRKSISRPLLPIAKDRIYATCEANGLDWISDSTNFQPAVTLRNAIRASLSGRDCTEDISPETLHKIENSIARANELALQDASASVHVPLQQRLRSWVTNNRDYVDEIEQEASRFIQSNSFPSPPSTVLLLTDELSPGFDSMENSTLHHSIILHVLRTVSPFPWGSPRSEAGRRTSRLQTIANTIFSEEPGEWEYNEPLIAGGDVMWTPVQVNTETGAFLDLSSPSTINTPGDEGTVRRGWIASRMPPRRFNSATSSYTKGRPLELDLTPELRSPTTEKAKDNPSGEVEFLWDSRFAVRIRPALLPERLRRAIAVGGPPKSTVGSSQARILVLPHSRWVLPRLVLDRGPSQKPQVLAEIGEDGEICLEWFSLQFARDPGALTSERTEKAPTS